MEITKKKEEMVNALFILMDAQPVLLVTGNPRREKERVNVTQTHSEVRGTLEAASCYSTC